MTSFDFLSNSFLYLYGLGKANRSVKNFLDNFDIHYEIIYDLSFDVPLNAIIIKSPGINKSVDQKKVEEKGIKIVTDIGFYSMLFDKEKTKNTLIGITGTFGKTTASSYLYHLLRENNLNAYLMGNNDHPIFDYYDKINAIFVIELSSFELEYCDKIHFDKMVYLNIYSHHLEHHESFLDYVEAKMNPLFNMKYPDTIYYNEEVETYIPKNSLLKVVGKKITNLNNPNYSIKEMQNLWLVSKVAEDLIHAPINLFKSIDTFIKPKYREEVKRIENQIIINDAKSTSLLSLKESLSHYNSRPFYLMCGGKLNLNEEVLYFNETIDILYLFGENRFKMYFLFNNVEKVFLFPTLIECFKHYHEKFGVLLFSPGAQSYDQFNNFIERGELFDKIVLENLSKKE